MTTAAQDAKSVFDGVSARLSDHEVNMLRLLKAIRRAEPVARTELVELTGLGGATVSALTGEFLREEVLLEARIPAVGRGRPRLALRINPDKGRVASACILPSGKLDVAIANLRGDRLFSQRVDVVARDNLEQVAEDFAQRVSEVIAESGTPKRDIQCVGVGLPAIIDTAQGVVHWMSTFKVPVPVSRIIQKRLKIPVVLDNLTNILARGEHWFGDRELDDFSLVTFTIGIGFGQYVDGALWTGVHNMTSAFAHSKVALEHGRSCICGGKGCVAAYASIYGIVSQTYEADGVKLPALGNIRRAFRTVAARAERGDRAALAAFQNAGKVLGVALANQINLGGPGTILVLVPDDALTRFMSAPVRAAIRENIMPTFSERVSIDFRTVDEDQYSQGAAALVLERLYRRF